MAKKRKALVDIFHQEDGVNYPAGSVVTVDHLTDEELATLVARGVYAPEGDSVIVISELEDLSGIGTENAKALANVGIASYQSLIDADPTELEQKIGTVTVKEIRAWQRAAKRAKGA